MKDHHGQREEQKAVKIPKQALNAIQDAWRTIPEDYLKILPNISGYVDELFFRLLYCNSVCVYTFFNKLLHLFRILAKSKKLNAGLGLLHSALCAFEHGVLLALALQYHLVSFWVLPLGVSKARYFQNINKVSKGKLL